MKFKYRKYILWAIIILLPLLVILIVGFAESDLEMLVTFFIFFYFGFLIFLGVRWFIKQYKSLVILKNEKSKTELMHLKSQVNPHFFFNMLNNLYGLVDKDSKKAQELILKLSDLMRYSIYDGQNDTVTLEEEIDYLKNYVELHKMRYHKRIDVTMNLEIKEEGYKVMPLLFIILLENAFKHGVENLRDGAFVNINMRNGNNEIHFEVENNYDASAISDTEGIGLKNLKRRLELVYPSKHSLSFSDTDGMYKATLNLTL